jgi:hypothetical protein
MRIVAIALVLGSAPAFAGRCDIFNDSGETWTIESGNTSNQRIGAHTHTSIDAGKITAKSDTGKSVGGTCADASKIAIVDDHGVFVIKTQ